MKGKKTKSTIPSYLKIVITENRITFLNRKWRRNAFSTLHRKHPHVSLNLVEEKSSRKITMAKTDKAPFLHILSKQVP